MVRFLLLLVCATPALAAPPVSAVAYHPEGKWLAAGTTGSVALIDPKSGTITTEWTGLPGRITALAFSRDRLAIACGQPGQSGVIRVVDPTSPDTVVAEYTAHKDTIYGLAFSPDGLTLATTGYDKLVKLWTVPIRMPAEPRLTLTDHSDVVYSVAFHPKGTWLATGSADRTVKVWDPVTGRRLYTLSDPTDWVYAVNWSPNGEEIVAGGVDKSIRVWRVDAEGGKLLASVFAHGSGVSRLIYTENGRSLVSLGEDRVIKTWDARKWTETRAYPPAKDEILALAWRPDGQQFAVGRFHGGLDLVDPQTGKPTSSPLPAKPQPPTLSKLSTTSVTRGQTLRLTVEGTRLSARTRWKTEPHALTLTLVPEQSTDTKQVLEVAVPNGTPIGPLSLVAESDAGASNKFKLHVDRFPVQFEQGTTDSARLAMPIPWPATVVGKLDRSGDGDFFRFTGQAGLPIGVQVLTDEPQSKFDPVVVLTNESGAILAVGTGGHLGYTCPTAGTYCVGVRDRDYRGGPEYSYRAHIGPIPVVTGVFPRSVARGRSTSVEVQGVNLGLRPGEMFTLSPPADAEIGSKLVVPIRRPDGDVVGSAEVSVGEFPDVRVSAAGHASWSTLPASASGVLTQPGVVHEIRFPAKRGQPLVLETHAARLGAPTDTVLDIQDATGKPVPRAVLRCTAKTYSTFRDVASSSPGIRLEYWNELGIDDLLYVGTEVVRIKALPKGPDDDAQFYEVEGKRTSFLGTTPTSHAMGSPMYKVEVHPPGATFPPNGMPIFPIVYHNDDGGTVFGKDSYLMFDPPADGEYIVRVSEANRAGSPNHAYRVTARAPRPDFEIRVSPSTAAKVWKGGAIPITVTASRFDDFVGPITLRLDGLTPPLSALPTTIEARQHTAVLTLSADAAVKATPTMGLRLIATATLPNGQTRTREVPLPVPTVMEPGDLVTAVSTTELTLRPGSETRMVVKVERRNGLAGRVPLEVRNLPHGVRVMNIGLSGILILPGQTEREVVIYAEPWVEPQERPVLFSARSERKNTEHAAPPVMLRILK